MERRKSSVAYLRVSTEEQTVENQRLVLQKWAEVNNYQIAQFFEDSAVSGKTPAAQRNGFQQMTYMIRKVPMDAVLVYELSRVGRTFWDTLEAIKAIERFAPLISVSPKESFLQTTDPSIRKLMISILSWAAEREREVLIERIKAGMARAKLEGVHIGRREKEIDYDDLRSMLNTTMKMDEIALALNISKPTLYRKIRKVV